MTAGLHLGEIKKIPAPVKARETDSADLRSLSCIVLAMNKSSPRRTMGAPAAEHQRGVQTHRAATESQVLGAAQSKNTGTRRGDLKLLWKPESQAHITG